MGGRESSVAFLSVAPSLASVCEVPGRDWRLPLASGARAHGRRAAAGPALAGLCGPRQPCCRHVLGAAQVRRGWRRAPCRAGADPRRGRSRLRSAASRRVPRAAAGAGVAAGGELRAGGRRRGERRWLAWKLGVSAGLLVSALGAKAARVASAFRRGSREARRSAVAKWLLVNPSLAHLQLVRSEAS